MFYFIHFDNLVTYLRIYGIVTLQGLLIVADLWNAMKI